MTVRLAPGLREHLMAHASRAAPIEACGLIGGNAGELLVYVPCRNALQSPTRFAIAPEEILSAERRFAAEGLELRAIFHSHPQGLAWPSATDLREATYPEAYYLIAAPGTGEVRGFRLEGEEVREEMVDG